MSKVVGSFLPSFPAHSRSKPCEMMVACWRCLLPTAGYGLFEALVPERVPYRLRIAWPNAVQETRGCVFLRFVVGQSLTLLCLMRDAISNWRRALGAQSISLGGVNGVRFAVWAPNAKSASLWSAISIRGTVGGIRCVCAIARGFRSYLFPASRRGSRGANTILLALTATVLRGNPDPLARQSEPPPQAASIVAQPERHDWRDSEWMQMRGRRHAPDAPIFHL